MTRFTILCLIMAATITGQKAMTNLKHQRTSDQDEDCSSDVFEGETKAIVQDASAYE